MHRKRNILTAIEPLFTFSSCLCLSFFSLKDGKIIVSESKTFSSVIVFILCFILKYIRVIWYSLPGYEILVINFTTHIFMFFCFVSFFNGLIKRKSIVKLWNELIPLAGFITDDAFFRRIYWTNIFQLVGFNAAYISFLVFYYYFFSMGLTEITYYLAFFADYCVLMHFCIMAAFFSGGLFLGAQLISTANEELLKLKKIEYYRNCTVWEGLEFVKVEKIKNLRSQLKMINQEDLSPLVDIYEKLCACFEELNECFGVSVTASCLNNMMEMTLCCYFMIKHGWAAVRLFSFWLLYCFINEWYLIHACEKFLKETKRTGYLVDLIVTDSSSHVLKNTVQTFSRHLLHRRMKFTACRLFNLDYQLLYSIMTNIITYLVIVVQFDNSRVVTS